MLRYSLRSLDKLDALKEQERLEASAADAQSPTPKPTSSASINYFDYPLNLLLVAALIAFDPANPYQSSIKFPATIDSSRIPRGVLGN